MTYKVDLTYFPLQHLSRRLAEHVSLLRPSHWSKSIIAVPIALFLMPQEATIPGLVALLGGMAMFILASSAVYVINDLSDIERDKHHPVKRLRPLPSGAVAPATARLMLLTLAMALMALSLVVPLPVTLLVALYLLCNLAYSIYLKHVPIVEMLIVAFGFALRTASGYVALDLALDGWVIAAVFAGSLLLTVGKRREELKRVKLSASHRPVLTHYTKELLDVYLIVAAIACLGAVLLAMSHIFNIYNLPILFFISLPFAIYMFQHYLLLVFARSSSSNPTKMILTDRAIHMAMFLWVLSLGVALLLHDTAAHIFLPSAL